MGLLEDEGDEVAAFSDDIMNVSLYLEGVEVVHGLDGVHVLIDHADHVLEIIGFQDALFELRPSCLDDVCLEVGPQVVDGEVHAPSGRTQLAFKDLILTKFVQMESLTLLLFHSSWDFHEDLLHLYLYLPDGEEKLVDPAKDLHEIRGENEVDRPTHL